MFFRRKPKIKRPLYRRIINYFIGVTVSLVVIVMIGFAYTQTSSFRNWLKDFIVEEVNSSTSGDLSIARIDGTIFTSLILSKTIYTFDEDTLFSADKIEVKFSPLRIFLKSIYFRKLEIENAKISLLKDENGELNISKLTSPSVVEEVEDTVSTSEPFSWQIDVAELRMKNIDFKHQSVNNKNSTAYYPQPEMDDFRVEDMNLSLSASIDIESNEYSLQLSELSLKPNLAGFKLINLSGNFILLNDVAGVTDLKIDTERSNISVNGVVSDFSPFSDEEFDLQNSPVKIEMDAIDFNFDDLTNFIEGTDLLRGSMETHVQAEGTFNDLELKNLEVEFNETRLQAEGRLQNVLDGEKMKIYAQFKNSVVNQDDVKNLLHKINIPVYKDYGLLQFDSLYFDGQPLKFKSGLVLRTLKGNISSDIVMDLSGEEIIYDFTLDTKNLNLKPIAGVDTDLNLIGSLTGKGFSPQSLETSVHLDAVSSIIGDISFDDFSITAEGSEGFINTQILFSSLQTKGKLNSDFDFTDSASTKYNFNIALNGFNISDIMKESGLKSEINISLKGDGENFDQDKLNLFAVIEIDSSKINDILIDSTTLIADIRSDEENRIINIVSDLADLTITGKYTLLEIADVFTSKASMLSTSIKNKIEQIQLPDFNGSQNELLVTETFEEEESITNRDIDADYLLELKSFELLSLFLGNSEIQVDGEITGKIFSSGDRISVTLESEIEQMRYWDGLELFYLYDFKLSLMMDDRISVSTFDDLKADINIEAGRIFIGSDIENFSFKMNLDQKRANIDFRTKYDEFSAIDLSGSFYVNDDILEILFDKVLLKHKDFDLQNSGDVDFSYSHDNFKFNSFTLVHNGGKIDLSGDLSLKNNENLTLKISRFGVKDLAVNMFDIPFDKSFDGELNLNLFLYGTAENPTVDLNYTLDSIKVQNQFLGSIESTVQYSNKLLSVDTRFYETEDLKTRNSLGLSGSMPVDLSFYSKERFTNGKLVDLTFFADNFDLRFMSGFISGIKNLKGQLNGEVRLNGQYENLQSSGELSIENSSFVLEAVNLTYLLDAKINFEDNRIILSRLNLKNEPKIKGGGLLTAYGDAIHDNFDITNVELHASGEIKLLDERSKAANPSLFGDLVIKTRKDIIFSSTKERSYLAADLILKRGASLTYSPTQSAFTNENDKFTYVFRSMRDEDLSKKEIDSLITMAEATKEKLEAESKIPFDLNLKIEVEREAKMVFVLSREFKQNLTAYLGGNFEYSVIDNVPYARGELKLLDGSKLDFIKTFQAEGNVEFLDELDNPYVNVTATYESYYSPDTLNTGSNEYDVQVRIKLEGPARSLTTNFLQDEGNIEIYKRRKNYGQFELDPSKTSSDAMFFIIVNKFPEDASLQESNLAVSTAASLAGSIVGNVLNEKLGDVVRSVNVQQVGSETKFSLIGKVEEFRYEIGGTSQVFQDFSRANVKIEHPLFFQNFIIKFDRKEPSYQSATYSEMINELGLKYSFVF